MKSIIWLGSSYNDLLDFPKEARQSAGYNSARSRTRRLETHDRYWARS